MDYPHWLLAAFCLFWLTLAIRPRDRVVWLTESALTIVVVVALASTYFSWPLSNFSYSLVAAFLVMHTIGGHFTYARVPYDVFLNAQFGLELHKRFGWSRNHYDRLVHFAYGLLITYPFYEMLERYAEPNGIWSYFLAPALIMASSMVFEVFEWWAAEALGGDAGSDYVGSQGDAWDAQKDMALATGGSILTMIVTAL